MNTQPIILFDGVCNLCNGAVQFVIRHDPHHRFLFAALQSQTGQSILNKYHLTPENLSSFALIQNNELYTKSTAALKVARQVKGPWHFLYIFIIVPRFIRDAVYKYIAENRYRWFGKKETCMIPTPELRDRFLQ